MIIVRLEGGLGNQLFQFSYALKLSKKLNLNLVLDTSLIETMKEKSIIGIPGVVNGSCAFEQSYRIRVLIFLFRNYAVLMRRAFAFFGIHGEELQRRLASCGVIYQVDTRYREIDPSKCSKFLYVHGNWMSEKFFLSHKRDVLQVFKPGISYSDDACAIIDALDAERAVCVHVRRGDYLDDKWKSRLHVCTSEYYEQAVRYHSEKIGDPKFYIFSNSHEDVEWIRNNFHFLPSGTVYINFFHGDLEHFFLMALFKNFVIANSTFSWWASYISGAHPSNVVAPGSWNNGAWDMVDIYRQGWVSVRTG